MSILADLSGPADLRELDDDQLTRLAAEIRELLIVSVASNGGHLGPNLGVVELGIAIHRVFDSPADRIVWDTGHQSYVHKMLTGRAGQFGDLRREGGLSGYPSRAESEHDWVENSHASTSLSYADGMAKANLLLGKDDYVVAVIGDGALTGGMAWEALNNIAADSDRRLIAVVNDNGRSYTPTVGGLANRLTEIRTNPRYEPTLSAIKERLTRNRFGGARAYEALHAIKKGVKDALAPQGMFEDLGLKYIGPVDGHDRAAVEHALERAKTFGGPVLVHVLTTKGQGYDIAVANENDQMHQASPFDRATGDALSIAPAGWTSVFRDEIVRIADERPDVVGITAAMLYPVGLDAFADKFPDRVFDVGIAEQHAVTSAAGLAMGGLHPVVAVYATFINRAFDQVLLDVALHGCGVTFVLDRAGVTGDDGASHNGMWDMSLLQIVPGIRIAAPRDGVQLRELLREAVDVDDAPTVVRFAKGAVCADLPAVERIGTCDVLTRDDASDVLVVAVGAFGHLGIEVAGLLRRQGLGVTVVDPRWVKPVDAAVVELAATHSIVVTVEDNGRHGGVGSAIAQAVRDAGIDTPVQVHGVEQEFL
ncbi:MAG: 1-deoxy-D-xylulose-5-phosphate synthase, partial [Aeromicrobium sp.]